MSTPSSNIGPTPVVPLPASSADSSLLQIPGPSSIDIEAVIQAATSSSGQLSPASRDTRTQLFVGNLPYRVRWQDLKDLFRKAGTVLRADVSLGPDNRSRGYGTVLMASAEDAKKAVDMFSGFSWQTRTLEVRSDRIPPDLDLSNPLNALQFSKAQNSSGHVYPFIPPVNGAFVNMDPVAAQIHARAAAEAQQALGLPVASPIPPSTVPSVNITPNLSATGASKMLFVGNLPFHCQWQELKDLFRTAGQIVRADVALGPDGRSRGFGTVLFANEVDAAAAVAMFNGFEFNGRTLKVHHDKFSQGHDSQSPSLGPISGHSTHAPSSPLPDYSLNRSPAFSPAFGSPSFAQQQMLGIYQQQGYALASPSPFQASILHSRPGSPFPPHVDHPGQYPSALELSRATPEVLAHPIHGSHLRASLATPPPAPARPLASGRSSAITKQQSQSGTPAATVGLERSESKTIPMSEPSSSKSGSSSTPEAETFGAPGSITSAAVPAPLGHAPKKKVSSARADGRRPPGLISLPPSSSFSTNPLSPHMTRGIPITPSMPGFTFHAPPMSTPPLSHHLLSPGLGPFSPGIPYYTSFVNTAPGGPLPPIEPPPSMFSMFGPTSHYSIPPPVSPLHHPLMGATSEYYQTSVPPPDSVLNGGQYYQMVPVAAQDTPVASPHNQQSPSEAPDYFSAAVSSPREPNPTEAVSLPIGRSISVGVGSVGWSSEPSTVPSSSGASSPRRVEPSSRGTSLPADGDEHSPNSARDSPPVVDGRALPSQRASGVVLPSGSYSSVASHGRAKSQSPNESVPSLAIRQIQPGTPGSERRMSWNDLSGLQRGITKLSLKGKGDRPRS